jgi:hypothetical protein
LTVHPFSTATLRATSVSGFPNREKYSLEVPVLYEFKTRLLERLKGIRHSSRPSLEAVRGDIGMFRLLIADQRPIS